MCGFADNISGRKHPTYFESSVNLKILQTIVLIYMLLPPIIEVTQYTFHSLTNLCTLLYSLNSLKNVENALTEYMTFFSLSVAIFD